MTLTQTLTLFYCEKSYFSSHYETMKILVTGSSGTIGTRLCETLLAEGHEVVGVDRVPNKWKPEVDAVTQQVDLLDADAVMELPGDVDAVVHLAANARVYDLVEDPALALENFTTTFNTLEFTRVNDINRFIFASSREGYGNIGVDKLTEDLLRVENCESPYTASKIGGEALMHAYSGCYGIDTVILRFSNVYGMYDESNRVTPLYFNQAKAGETMTVFGKDKCLDFTYIDDAVRGVILVLEKLDDVKGETFNIAYGEGTTIVHVAETMKELLGSSSEIEITDNRTGEVIKYVADISKAKKLLGYDPKTPFEEGIKKSVEWYEANT